MSNVVEIPHIVKSRNFILLKNTTLTNNKKNCSAEAAAASIISSSTKVLRSADLNEFSITNSTKRLILPNKNRLAPKNLSLENGKNTTFIFLPVSLALTAAEKQREEVNLVQSTAKMDDLADTFKFKSASAASSLQSYHNGDGGGGNGFYAKNGHFDDTCLKNESTASLALKRHSIVLENGSNSTKKSRSSIGDPSSNKSSYSAPTTPKNFNNLMANGEHTTSLDDNSSSTSKNFGAARAILADRLKNSQKNRKKYQPKEETINEGICFKSDGLDTNDREISLDRKGDIFIDLTGTKSSLAITAPTTQNGNYFSFSELSTSNNHRRLSYPVSATFQNSSISGDTLLNDNELILLTPSTTSTQSAGPASLFLEHNDLHRPPPPLLPFEIGHQQHQTTFNRRPSETTPPSGSLELCATIPTNISINENLSSPVAVASSFNQQQQNNEYTANNNKPFETKNQEIRSINDIQFDGVCRPDLDLVDALSFPPSTSTAYVVHSSEIIPNGETAPDSFQIVYQQQLQSELVIGKAPTSAVQKSGVATASTAPTIANLKTPKQPSAMCGYVTLEKDGLTQTPCRQRCINGFKFCIRHILNDSSAPYKPCAHVRVTGTKSIPCNNAVLQQPNVNSKYCGTHLIMMGLRTPKTRKTKHASSVEQSVKDSVGCSSSTVTTTDPVVKSTKKSTNKSAKSQKSTQERKNLNENYANFAAPPSCFPPNNNINNNCDNTANEYFTVDNQQQQQSQYLMQQNLYTNHQGSSGSTPSSSNYHNQEFSITSRPDSQVSVSSSSMQYINNNNNNNGYCSPQSPWRSNVQNQQVPPPPPPNISLADIAKNNPELLSKLTFNPENKELMDESNTITLYTIPENSIIYSPNQNLKSPPKNFVLADHNFLLRSDDPFLCPQNSSSSDPNTPQKFVALQQRSLTNFQQQQSILTNNILSPVPSDLSVESSGSQSSANVRHNFLNKNIYQQQTTNSPFLQQNFQNQTISTENQECSFVLSNGQNSISGQSFISSNLPPILRSHSTRPSAEIMLASPVPSPSVSIPRPYSSSLLPSNTNNNNNIGNEILNANPYPSTVNQPRQQIIRQIEQQDGKICYLISDISVPGLDPQTTIPSVNKKIVDQSKAATVLTNQTSLAAPSSTISNQGTVPGVAQRAPNVAAAPSTKPKKVIRLKPKKRKLKMTGKYREIGFVNQMCRIVEDFDFDNTDLFPLGLEPSSSDSDSDDDTSHTGNMSLPKFDYDNFIVPQIADSVDNNNSVSSAFLSKAKRQLYLLKKNLNLTCKDLRRSHVESKIVGSTARLFPNSCGQAFYDLKCSNYNRSNSKRLAQIKRYQAIKRPSCHVDLGVVPKKCAYKFGVGDSKENKCQEKCLPYSIMCPKHILAHNEQTLFRNCTYRGSDDCPEPPCPMTALPAGLTEGGSFLCYKHQSKDLHKNSDNPEAININSASHQIKDKKRSKKTTAKKTTRKRNKKQTVPIGPYSDHSMAVIRPLYTPDEEASESADEHANEEYSNQDAQAALASVAKDFGFANYDLTDMLVRMPDESLIDNILDQDFSKSSLTELQPLQNVAVVGPSPSTSSLPPSSSDATGLHTAAAIISGGVFETFERLTTTSLAVSATGDHNWADIEQFLLEENIKASTSVSPHNNDLTSPTADFQASTTPLLHYNDNSLQYFDLKKNNNGQKREELRSLDCSDVQNVQLLR